MKKLLFCLAAAIALVACETNRNSDYLTPRDFVVVNRTDSQIAYTDTTLDITVKVAPGETKQVFDREFIYQKGDGYADLVPFGQSFFASPQNHILSFNNKKFPDTIWLRDHWEFSPHGDRFPTYTLTVTDELIASVPTNETTKTRAAAPYQVNPNNPYSLSVVQRSLNVLEGANAPTLSATHHYIRILPRDTIEVKILTNDLSLDLLPYPFDYELTDVEIANYENTLINGFAWQYCLVEPDFQIPSGINYELLDYAYLQNDEPGTRSPYEQLDRDLQCGY